MTKPPYFNRPLYNALAKQIGLKYDKQKGREVVNAVHKALLNALGVDDDEIFPNAGLVANLSAESIDGLDIKFRIDEELKFFKQDTNLLGQLNKLIPNPDDLKNPFVESRSVLELAVDAYNLYINK